MAVTITIPDSLRVKLNPATLNGAINKGLDAAAERVRGFMATYPGSRPQPNPPKSDRQRRFLHWAFRNGVLGSPYQRTGALAAGWNVETSGANGRAIFNEVPHADLVQGPGQAGYHSGNWFTVDDGARLAEQAVPSELEIAISEVFG